MGYRVKIMPRAERDLADIYRRINASSSDAAYLWYTLLRDAIRSLRDTPNRCPPTPEDKNLRHLLYGGKPYVYRVIYRVVERYTAAVDILHVRRGSRQEFRTADLR
jgi:plasmid stabilization system protein ParE